MSDKPVVQQELADRLSQILLPLKSERSSLYLRTFWITMEREWTGIDRLRMDKFMSLVRKFVHQSFVYARNYEWDMEIVQQTSELFASIPLSGAMHVRGVTT